jgi:hypothetical protein
LPEVPLVPAYLNHGEEDYPLSWKEVTAHEQDRSEEVTPLNKLVVGAGGCEDRDHTRARHDQRDLAWVHVLSRDGEGVEAHVREKGREARPLKDQEKGEKDQHDYSHEDYFVWMVVRVFGGLKKPPGS